MHSERELAPLMNLLSQEIKQLIRADLVSVFGFDRDKCELRSFLTSDNQEIRFDARLGDRKSTRLNSSHIQKSRMPSSA